MNGNMEKNAIGSHTLAKQRSKICLTGRGLSTAFVLSISVAASVEAQEFGCLVVPFSTSVVTSEVLVTSTTTGSEVDIGATLPLASRGVLSFGTWGRSSFWLCSKPSFIMAVARQRMATVSATRITLTT